MAMMQQITIDIPRMPSIKAQEVQRVVQEYVNSLLLHTTHYGMSQDTVATMCAEETPEAITLATLNEAKSGKYAGVIDTSSEENFIKSLGL